MLPQVDREEYLQAINSDLILGVVIEEEEAVANLREIVSLGVIDFFGLGVNDLAQSLGLFGQTTHSRVQGIVEYVRQTVHEYGGVMEDDIMVACWITTMISESATSQINTFREWDAGRMGKV
jgi:2-keto-3-deoxy-L-rhamnonate aldolase RhmA